MDQVKVVDGHVGKLSHAADRIRSTSHDLLERHVSPRLYRLHTNPLSTVQDRGGVATACSMPVTFVAQQVRVRLLQRHDLCIYK